MKLSVVSKVGREAIVAMLGPGDFCGEGGLAGQPLRIATATALTPTTALVIGKAEMIRVLHAEHALSDRFIAHMLSRNIRIEEDLIDQLFNSSEKRLARALLLLARYGTQDSPTASCPKISQATLAEHGRDDALARERLPEQVQAAGVHRRRRRRNHDQQLPVERRAPRLALPLSRTCLFTLEQRRTTPAPQNGRRKGQLSRGDQPEDHS